MGCARPQQDVLQLRRNEHVQVTLITEAPARVQIADYTQVASPGTLCLVRAGERYGLACSGAKPPLLWEVYLLLDARNARDLPGLLQGAACDRVLRLSSRQLATFHGQFVTLFMELHLRQPGCDAVASALLTVLLATIERWIHHPHEAVLPVVPAHADADVLELWRRLHVEAASPDGAGGTLHDRVPGYDALRHRFRRTFGESPRQTWIRLRMQQAKRLLVETDLPIHVIAERLGYTRQHEFARAFHREVGGTPTWWRAQAGDPRDP